MSGRFCPGLLPHSHQAAAHGIATTGELMRLILDPYPIDIIKTLLPANNFYLTS
jgi:hypothetical protein